MHAITQFQGGFKPIQPIILAGQNNLADLLIYRASMPLASRVVARSYLAGISLQDMQGLHPAPPQNRRCQTKPLR
ncbi:hypothetical protein DFAR_570023 [Desulfarculales bacterium]